MIEPTENRKNLQFPYPTLLATFAACLCTISTQATNNSVVQNSPFIPEGWSAPAPKIERASKPERKPEPVQIQEPESPINLELKGVSVSRNSINNKYYIFDTTTKSGTWVTINDPNAPYLVTRYNGESITVEINGKSHEIGMEKSNGVPMQLANPLTDPRTNRNRRYTRDANGKRVLIRHDLTR